MTVFRRSGFLAQLFAALFCAHAAAQQERWPPPLAGAGTLTASIKDDALLAVPKSVAEQRDKEGVVAFDVAKTAPAIDFAYHQNLGPDAITRRLWSSWGDICLASDGRVYCGIGDHADDAGGDARCFIYRWDPKTKRLEQIVDMNEVMPDVKDLPAWSKVHAKIDEGPDGAIYFSCTLNDGNRVINDNYHWTDEIPGGQIYRFDPQTGKTTIFASLPPRNCTATSLVDQKRGIWWCNLEGGKENNGLWAFDLKTRKEIYRAPNGSMKFNRAFALASDGSIYFNGADGIWRCDAAKRTLKPTGVSLGGSPGMRSATRESKEGVVFGATYQTNQLFSFHTRTHEAKLLGPTFLSGEYTTVTILSPDEKHLYYLPGAHGKAWQYGTPVIQYDIASGRRKVLAFLAETMERRLGYVPGGTYGVKLSADGATLYVNFNGHAADSQRPEKMKPNGFGLCGFAAIHIPESER